SAHLGDKSRRLVLFDTTADPLHRPELKLELWGTDRDLLSPTSRPTRSRMLEPTPPEIAATGYPGDKISVRRYPREDIAQSDPVAFLTITSHTYESHRTAIATFIPRLARGGIIAVERDPYDASGRDGVDDFLCNERLNLLLVPVEANYRIGVKP